MVFLNLLNGKISMLRKKRKSRAINLIYILKIAYSGSFLSESIKWMKFRNRWKNLWQLLMMLKR